MVISALILSSMIMNLNNFTVYNPLTGEIESYNLTKTNFVEVNNIDDREHETNHNDLDINNIDVNDIMIFNEVIKDPTYELSPEKFLGSRIGIIKIRLVVLFH